MGKYLIAQILNYKSDIIYHTKKIKTEEERKKDYKNFVFIIYGQLLYVCDVYIYNIKIYIHIIDRKIIYIPKLSINDHERINQNEI